MALPDYDLGNANKGPVPDPLTDYLGPALLPYHPSDADMAAAAAYLNKLENIVSLDDGEKVSRVLPGNDVLLIVTRPVNQVIDRYRSYLSRTVGRYTIAQLAGVSAQLYHGGAERPFAVSDEAKRLSKLISDKAPLADYLRPLLAGDFQTAARVAWKRAARRRTTANTTPGSAGWRWRSAAATRRCSAREDFIKWTKGTLKRPDGQPVNTNPEAAFLGG